MPVLLSNEVEAQVMLLTLVVAVFLVQRFSPKSLLLWRRLLDERSLRLAHARAIL